ncbi:cytochrome P450 [Paraconexibacter antarcticus]|uniref:Cytochrome P450 n=1 Tax=Paraconexibacter antarcticus TaxID=2949664 RepID=A0ABY5DMM0_9ACTN|nr:cytochrome P450 [Paraconexibacter antarcticus]UTI62650.1 cytochrome P450 [Paraconexibacter antarcticus]
MSTTPVLTDVETFAFWERSRQERMAAFKWLRENDPVSWHPPADSLLMDPEDNVNGFWALTKHAHIQEASRSRAFCSSQGIFMEDMPEVVLAAAMSFLAMDPPDHGQMRGIVQTAFGPKQMRTLEGWIRETANEVVAGLRPQGQADLVADLGKALPGLIYSHFIGVTDAEMRDKVVAAADQLGSWNDPKYTEHMEPIMVFANAAEILSDIALELAELRLKEPGDDMLTWLVQAEFEGRKMDDWEIASFFVMLSGASNDTTGHAIVDSIMALESHPEQKAWLFEDFEGRIGSAVEELLRWRCPIVHFRRTAVQDYDIGGKTIKEGDKVVFWYVSGNYDEDVFENPEVLDLSRERNPHLAFGGGGIHFCLGNALGRTLLKAALREVYTQLPDLQLGEATYGFSNLFETMRTLPATWTV